MLGALATIPLARSSDATAHALADRSGTPPAGATITPEQFGAIGDGVKDDAPALQQAMDTLVARPQGGTLLLQAKTAYRCNSGLSLDASYVSLAGTALLDFSSWQGRYLRVTASSLGLPGREPDNNYGRKGMISGAIRVKGAGQNTASIGVDFDSPNIATSAQMMVENLSVFGCGIGLRFGNRAYNNLLVHCEVFDCGICIDWPAAQDNGERNTLVGCTLYNSTLAVRVALGSASLQLQGCSLDYTVRLYEVTAGSVLATSCHHESDRWEDRPIRCSGDGSLVRLEGGWMLNQAEGWKASNLVDVGKGSWVHLIGMIAHNLTLVNGDPTRPASWGTGAGILRLEDTHSFEFSPNPIRLHTDITLLSDPDFRSAVWEDRVWRTRDTAPISDRYGAAPSNLALAKGSVAGDKGLIAAKAYGSTSPAAFVVISLPVRHGDAVLAGFRVRRDPRRPGAEGTLFVSPSWVRIDGEEHGVPAIVRLEPVGTLTVSPPTDGFLLVSPIASRSHRTAPAWATHFCMVVDLVKAHEASFLFNGLWADLI